MALFKYQARNEHGQLIKGQMMADSASQLAAQLESEQITPIKIKKAFMLKHWWYTAPITYQRTGTVNKPHLMAFCQQMAVLLNSGVTVTYAIKELGTTTDSPKLRYILNIAYKRLHAGSSLTEALSGFPKVFTEPYLGLLENAQLPQNSAIAFSRIADLIQEEITLRKDIRGMIIMPIYTIALTFIMMMIATRFILPFILESIRKKEYIPKSTLAIMATAQFFQEHGILLLVVIVVLLALHQYSLNFSAYRLAARSILERIPVIGSLFKLRAETQFLQAFSLGLQSHLPPQKILAIAAISAKSAAINQRIPKAVQHLMSGSSLTDTFRKMAFLPSICLHLIETGEKSDNLASAFINICFIYRSRLTIKTTHAKNMVYLIFLGIAATLVTFFLLGIYMGIIGRA